MGWREDMIAQYKSDIAEKRDGIERMRAGTFELRSLEDGKWVVINESCIKRDEETIATLEKIIARAEAEIAADAHRT